MKLPTTNALATGFPLVIPTKTQQPTARLMLRGGQGQIVQQWLVQQNKCTLGSAASCSLKCELPGIAPYHALLVIGARQIFIRALAPKLTRDGRPFNEILLSDSDSHFEIAGHRFELTRGGEQVRAAARQENTRPERLKFTLARPFELQQRNAVTAASKREVERPSLPIAAEHAPNSDSKWVAQLIQAAMQPLECQLHNLMEPLSELQSDSRKSKSLRRKRKAAKRRSAADSVISAQGDRVQPEPAPVAELSPQFALQVEQLVAKQAAAMDVLTERIGDVNHQLAAIERLVAEERQASPTAAPPEQVALELASDPQWLQQNAAIEQLQQGIVAVSGALQGLQSQQTNAQQDDQQWRTTVQTQLDGLSHVIDHLSEAVSQVHQIAEQGVTEAVSVRAALAAMPPAIVYHHPRDSNQPDAPTAAPAQSDDVDSRQPFADSLAPATDQPYDEFSQLSSDSNQNYPAAPVEGYSADVVTDLPAAEYLAAELDVADVDQLVSDIDTAEDAAQVVLPAFEYQEEPGAHGTDQSTAEDQLNYDEKKTFDERALQNSVEIADDADQSTPQAVSDSSFAADEEEFFGLGNSESSPQLPVESVSPEAESTVQEEASWDQLEPSQASQQDSSCDSAELATAEDQPRASAAPLPSWWVEEESAPPEQQEVQQATPEVVDNLPEPARATEDFALEHAGVGELSSRLADEPLASIDDVSAEPVIAVDTPSGSLGELSEEFYGLAEMAPEEHAQAAPQAQEVATLLERTPSELAEVDVGMEPLDGFDEGPSVGSGLSEEPEAAYDEQPAVDNANEVSEEDDSVEEYMRKLLARMRGVPESEVKLPASKPTPAAPATTPAASRAPTTRPSSRPTEASSLPERPTTNTATATGPFAVDATEPFDPEKYMPRVHAPERSKSLAAMRELANSSARTAIHKSTRQRHVSSILLKAVIAVVGALVGTVLIAINGFNLNIGLVATFASYLVAAIWGYDSVSSIRPLLQAGLILKPQASRPARKADDDGES